ncbi:hypothetical protein [Burkholderia sp. SRS-W-2-2016]|uniref:hypothetical protein n=1 Tax=Burkholderia sp. SRS-W-2-2016 TaxID=1926878 RepID=UPI00117CCD45|nr:hypothetical protein [Burkholderia sp. SRS-W-2-2016]
MQGFPAFVLLTAEHFLFAAGRSEDIFGFSATCACVLIHVQIPHVAQYEFPVDDLVFPENFRLYMDHLYSLNLAAIRQMGNQEATFDGTPRVQTGVNINSVIALESFGTMFAKAWSQMI